MANKIVAVLQTLTAQPVPCATAENSSCGRITWDGAASKCEQVYEEMVAATWHDRPDRSGRLPATGATLAHFGIWMTKVDRAAPIPTGVAGLSMALFFKQKKSQERVLHPNSKQSPVPASLEQVVDLRSAPRSNQQTLQLEQRKPSRRSREFLENARSKSFINLLSTPASGRTSSWTGP